MTYVHNLETDKLNIFTGRDGWKALAPDLRDLIKRNCLFSRTQSCWISKGKAGHVWWKDQLVSAGFEDQGTQGERLSFAEQVEAKQERAEDRAERFEQRADKAETAAATHHKISHDMMDAIPFGQPILVGHYSEGRDRRYRDRAWNQLGKAVSESEKAKHYDGRAETARQTAEGKELQDTACLGRRIAEVEKEIRELEQKTQLHRERRGHTWVDVKPAEISDEYRTHLTEYITRAQEKLDFYKEKLADCVADGAQIFNRETLAGKTHVLIRHGWQSIVKLNPKTVSVPNICFPAEEDQRKWALKYPYLDGRDAR